jgi:hypothetical protein
MHRTTITIHSISTPSGAVKYARILIQCGHRTVGQSLMLHRLSTAYAELIEPGTLGVCLL